MSKQKKASTRSSTSEAKCPVARKHELVSSRFESSAPRHISACTTTVGNQVLQRLLYAGVIQAKLEIGQLNDKYEQEANRIAEYMMRSPESRVERDPLEAQEQGLQTKPLVEKARPMARGRPDHVRFHRSNGWCTRGNPWAERPGSPVSQRRLGEEAHEELRLRPVAKYNGMVSQTRLAQGPKSAAPNRMESKIGSMRKTGQPLPRSVRAYFEPRFGYDFGRVRVHTDSDSVRLNRSLNSRAFTVGQNIFLSSAGRGFDTSSDKKLLAHELTHVLQQGCATRLAVSSISAGAATRRTNPIRKRIAPRPPGSDANRLRVGNPVNAALRSKGFCSTSRELWIQRVPLSPPSVRGVRLGALNILPSRAAQFMHDPAPRLWRSEETRQLTATTEAVPVGDRAGTFLGFISPLEAVSFALLQPVITVIVEDDLGYQHVLNTTENSVVDHLTTFMPRVTPGVGFRPLRAVNPSLPAVGTGASTWSARVARADTLRQQYANESNPRDEALWRRVEQIYTELAVEVFSVPPAQIYVMDYRLASRREPRPGQINISLNPYEQAGGRAGPGELDPSAAAGSQVSWLMVNSTIFAQGPDAVRRTFRHEAIHTGTRERVRRLMTLWQGRGRPGESFFDWLQRQQRRRGGGPFEVSSLDLRLAQSRILGLHTDEALTAVMTFTATYHRVQPPIDDDAFFSIRYMLTHWHSSRLVLRAQSIRSLRTETMRRLRVYYLEHLDQPHRDAFDGWLDRLPGASSSHVGGSHEYPTSTWQQVQGVIGEMRGFRRQIRRRRRAS